MRRSTSDPDLDGIIDPAAMLGETGGTMNSKVDPMLLQLMELMNKDQAKDKNNK